MSSSIRHLMKGALDVQNACNLSGVLYSWAEAMRELRDIEPDQGTDWYNTHPLNVLYASKVADLTGCQINFSDAYASALKMTA